MAPCPWHPAAMFKPISQGFSKYDASDAGEVRTIATGHMHKPTRDAQGYMRVCLTHDGGTCKLVRVHRLVAAAHIPGFDLHDRSKANTIDHINRDSRDNRAENLRVATMREQHKNRDQPSTTNRAVGVQQLDRITGAVIATHRTYRAAAEAIGKPSAIGNICNVANGKGKSASGFGWRNVPGESASPPGETWDAVADGVEVSSAGRVKRYTAGGHAVIKETHELPLNGGRPYLCFDGKSVALNKLVAASFNGFRGYGPNEVLHHKDGNPLNCAADNIALVPKTVVAQRMVLKRKHHSFAVDQLTADGQFVARHESAAAAARVTGIDPSGIRKACKGALPSAGRYLWKSVTPGHDGV